MRRFISFLASLTRFATLAVVLMLACFAPQAEALLTSSHPGLSAPIPSQAHAPESYLIIEEIHPLGYAEDGECLDLCVCVEPETLTRVFCIVKSPTGLATWDEFYDYHLSPDSLKFKAKVFGGVVGGAGKALYGVGKGTFVITAGSIHAYWGVESYADFEDEYLQMGEGIVSFVSHPVQTTKSGVRSWQNSITEALFRGDGYSVGSSVGNASMQGLIIGETVVNPAARLLSKAPGRVGSIGTTLTNPIYAFPTAESFIASLVPVKGITYKGNIYRYEMPERVNSTWSVHKYNKAANHRYSKTGKGAVYGSTSEEVALAEINHYNALQGRILISKEVSLNNVLDLTDTSVLKRLGVNGSSILNEKYPVTHWLSDWARKQGYQGLLVPSARNLNGANLVILGE